MLVQEHGAKFGEPVRWLCELAEDDRPLVDCEREQADPSASCAAQKRSADAESLHVILYTAGGSGDYEDTCGCPLRRLGPGGLGWGTTSVPAPVSPRPGDKEE